MDKKAELHKAWEEELRLRQSGDRLITTFWWITGIAAAAIGVYGIVKFVKWAWLS
jgi:hypothetical protein